MRRRLARAIVRRGRAGKSRIGSPPMDSSQFESRADATLARLERALEATAGDWLSAELAGGILTLELDSGDEYVINKHTASRQIWVASPASGAWHFAWSELERAWLATRGGERLEHLLAREIGQAGGKAIEIG
jgi:frataxin